MDLELLSKEVERCTRRIGSTAVLLLYAVGAFLALATGLFYSGHEPYYLNWGREFSLFTLSSSMQYFVASLAAFVCYWVAKVNKRRGTGGVVWPWLWLPVSVAFLYACMDESLVIHERVLAAMDEAHPWLGVFYFNAADDLFVISCGIGAVIFSFLLIREFWPVRRAVLFYLAGLALLIFAGLVDFLPDSLVQQRLPLGVEELAEYFAGTTFSIAFLLCALAGFRVFLLDWLTSAERKTQTVEREQAVQAAEFLEHP